MKEYQATLKQAIDALKKDGTLDYYKLLHDSIDHMFKNSIEFDRRLTDRNREAIFRAIAGLNGRYYMKGFITFKQYEHVKLKNTSFYHYRKGL